MSVVFSLLSVFLKIKIGLWDHLLVCVFVSPLTPESRNSGAGSVNTFPWQSESRYDRRSVGHSILVSSPIWGSWSDINYYLTNTVLSMSGAPSDERSGLSFVLVAWTASVQFSKFTAGPRRLILSRGNEYTQRYKLSDVVFSMRSGSFQILNM
jgi:hypothetical protein